MKEEKCFVCEKKNKKKKRKKRSRHWKTLSRVERDKRSVTLTDVIQKNEDLSFQCLCSAEEQLKVMFNNVDYFAADVLYHQTCYNQFIYSY